MANNSLEAQIKSAGINYTRKHDITYRTGLVLQVIGIAIFLAGHLFSFNLIPGLVIFEFGVFLSAFFLLVWLTSIKRFIITTLLIGVLLQIIGTLVTPFQPITFIIGVGFVCVAASGLVGKESYCFGYKEGWAIIALYPLLILLNIIQVQQRIIFSILYIMLLLLYASFLRKKLSQKLLQSCKGNVCPVPENSE